MSIRTILFDLDGTLIDTNELIIASFTHTFNYYKLNYTRDEIIGFNGPPLMDTFHQIDPARAKMMVKTYRKHNLAEHDNYVTAFPHVVETMEILRSKQIKLGVVTTKMNAAVTMGLTLTGLDAYFDTVITLDDVTHPKPHPEPVVKAMEELNAEASTTLMVGDNYHDIKSGKSAGVQTAGVAWSLKGKEHLLTYQPTYMLDDIRDLLAIVEV